MEQVLDFKWMGNLLDKLKTVPSSQEERTALLEAWVKEAGDIPDNTCPSIDSIIKRVGKAETALKNITSKSNSYKKTDCESDCSDYADDADYEIGYIEDALEELRKSNEKLRELGIYWYEKCKMLLEESEKSVA